MQFFENEIKEYAEFAWSTLDFKISPAAKDFDEKWDHSVTANVQISGNWRGVITLIIESDLAQKLAEKMFSKEKGQATQEEVNDAVSEMINMIGGNLKSILPQPCQLSLPIIDLKGAFFEFPFTEQRSKMGFECMGKKFIVSIHQLLDSKLPNPPTKAGISPAS